MATEQAVRVYSTSRQLPLGSPWCGDSAQGSAFIVFVRNRAEEGLAYEDTLIAYYKSRHGQWMLVSMRQSLRHERRKQCR